MAVTRVQHSIHKYDTGKIIYIFLWKTYCPIFHQCFTCPGQKLSQISLLAVYAPITTMEDCHSSASVRALVTAKVWILHQWVFEPAHEIMALIALRKLNLQTGMCSHPVGLHVWFSVRYYVYSYTSCAN